MDDDIAVGKGLLVSKGPDAGWINIHASVDNDTTLAAERASVSKGSDADSKAGEGDKEAPESVWIDWPRKQADDAWYWTHGEYGKIEYVPRSVMDAKDMEIHRLKTANGQAERRYQEETRAYQNQVFALESQLTERDARIVDLVSAHDTFENQIVEEIAALQSALAAKEEEDSPTER